MKLKGDKARVEVSPEVTTIMETKGGDILTLMNTKKKFVRISADKSKAIAELASKYGKDSSAPAEKSKLTATGRKEMINGYETEEYVRESSFDEGKLLDRAQIPGFGCNREATSGHHPDRLE